MLQRALIITPWMMSVHLNLIGAASQFARKLSIELLRMCDLQHGRDTQCTGAHASPAKETGRVGRVVCPDSMSIIVHYGSHTVQAHEVRQVGGWMLPFWVEIPRAAPAPIHSRCPPTNTPSLERAVSALYYALYYYCALSGRFDLAVQQRPVHTGSNRHPEQRGASSRLVT